MINNINNNNNNISNKSGLKLSLVALNGPIVPAPYDDNGDDERV
jgi:hypothetical protein